ncbi:NAD(P)H-dependent oxidoreductase subunit E [Dehalococcoidia bacterium]|nr:NAD(P)H-dependent oxidoreductase subunit E [Dehalococcoidia bacterium]
MEFSPAKIDEIIQSYNGDKGMLISILQDVQAECNYLPREVLTRISVGLDIPLGQVFSVATFFKAFSLKPRGRHTMCVCLGTACHVRGATRILNKLERDLKIRAGDTTDDQEVTLETVNCVGSCALGPIVILDGQYHGQMNMEKSGRLLKEIAEHQGDSPPETP